MHGHYYGRHIDIFSFIGSRIACLQPFIDVLLPHKEILDNIRAKLGQSETLRVAFLEYAKSISLITEKVHASQRNSIDWQNHSGRTQIVIARSARMPALLTISVSRHSSHSLAISRVSSTCELEYHCCFFSEYRVFDKEVFGS